MLLTRNKLWALILSAMTSMNPVFTEHGKRVALVMLALCRQAKMDENHTYKLVFASLFHEIGAFKAEDAHALLEFEVEETYRHSLEGYLFLKYFSPLGSDAAPVLYHHMSYRKNLNNSAMQDGFMIHLCDRLDVLFVQNLPKDTTLRRLNDCRGTLFDPELLDLLNQVFDGESGDALFNQLTSGDYDETLRAYFDAQQLSDTDVLAYLKMLIFTFEAVSPSTVFHSSMTAAFSGLLCHAAGMTREECADAYIAGMIHDIGKIRTPSAILEKPGALTAEEVAVIRRHPADTREMLSPYFEPKLVCLAYRHHEKLNGKGYPDGLTAAELSLGERAIGIADIISALYTKRSYKDALDTQTVCHILSSMVKNGEIDAHLTAFYLNDIERLNARAHEMIADVGEDYRRMQQERAQLEKTPVD